MNSRRKGAAGEREFAEALRELGFSAARRCSCMYGRGSDWPDVRGLDGVHVEVKRCERLDLHGAMEQSIRDSGPGEVPIVASRRNHAPWLLTLRLDDLLEFAKRVLAPFDTAPTTSATVTTSRMDAAPEPAAPAAIAQETTR